MHQRLNAGSTVYDDIGDGYARRRRPDPRIARLVTQALGDAETVINVGAGTGSYEPEDRVVVAVEPSSTMVRQRPRSSAPVIRAAAEALPAEDRTFDVATAFLTIHHWQDRAAGYRELRRVADRTVVLTYDPDVHAQLWLVQEYVPEVAELDRRRGFTLAEVVDALEPADIVPVPIPADCTDGFLMAFWRRPEAYLDPTVQQTTSGLAFSDPTRLRQGLDRLRADIASGAWHERHGELLERDTFDAGLRLIVRAH